MTSSCRFPTGSGPRPASMTSSNKKRRNIYFPAARSALASSYEPSLANVEWHEIFPLNDPGSHPWKWRQVSENHTVRNSQFTENIPFYYDISIHVRIFWHFRFYFRSTCSTIQSFPSWRIRLLVFGHFQVPLIPILNTVDYPKIRFSENTHQVYVVDRIGQHVPRARIHLRLMRHRSYLRHTFRKFGCRRGKHLDHWSQH